MTHTACTFLLMLLTLIASCATAAEVYTWIDDNGVTHFSETPPQQQTDDTQRIDLAPLPKSSSSNDEDDDYYSVVNQAERMEARRLENEKLAAEKKQASAEASKAQAEATAIQQGANNDNASDDSRYYPVYPYYPPYGHHPWGPGHGPKPVHPVYPGNTRPKNPRTSLGKTPGMPGQNGSWR